MGEGGWWDKHSSSYLPDQQMEGQDQLRVAIKCKNSSTGKGGGEHKEHYVSSLGPLWPSAKKNNKNIKPLGRRSQNWSHLGRAEEKVFLDTLSSLLCDHDEPHD